MRDPGLGVTSVTLSDAKGAMLAFRATVTAESRSAMAVR